MKILIVGAGRFGSSVAENLVSERNDITVVDIHAGKLAYLQERFDLRVVHGDGSLPNVLEEAGAEDSDLIVACAAHDAVNLVACKISRDLFNIPRRIACLRTSYYYHNADFAKESFGVDSIISPENSVTDYLYSLIDFPEALQMVEFANGRLSIMTLRVGRQSVLQKLKINEHHLNLPDINGRILEVIRHGEKLPLSRTFSLQADDEVVLVIDSREARKTISRVHRQQQKVRSIMIAGGGNIGSRLASLLADDNYNVRVIESDKERCKHLAAKLPDEVLVLHGDATDESLLKNENIAEMDTWLALTSDDEDNIMSSLLAKRLGARKVITLITRQAYGELMQGSMIDIAVSPAIASLGTLLHDVRQGAVVRGYKLHQGASEAVEFEVVGDENDSNITGRKTSDVRWPRSSVLAAIIREDKVIIPEPDTVFKQGDHVVIYATNRKVMERVEKLFQVKVLHF
ncbi:Trk system potassium transporter TrkA [Brackiella oedipodis]|uniref:Trk system potassium transporter TrkA n=1 Tax=Brackiella oedipodis TaxID=124225 RepID=UPI00048AA1B2|nr:Trk system potassium transporter TrkA [Brackiella oedipodis]